VEVVEVEGHLRSARTRGREDATNAARRGAARKKKQKGRSVSIPTFLSDASFGERREIWRDARSDRVACDARAACGAPRGRGRDAWNPRVPRKRDSVGCDVPLQG
jgi:hypothetical protein